MKRRDFSRFERGLIRPLAMATLWVAAGTALAQAATASGHAGHSGITSTAPALSSATSRADMASGEVRRIDREGRKSTLRHGEIANLAMPPMTMVFQVVDPGLLDRAKVGDRVQFHAEKVEGAYRVTEIVPAP